MQKNKYFIILSTNINILLSIQIRPELNFVIYEKNYTLIILFSLLIFVHANQKKTQNLNGNILRYNYLRIISKKSSYYCKKFLSYIKQNRYGECHFYRVLHSNNQPENKILIEVIQGGLGIDKHPLELKAITHENTDQTNILHKNGTISMARLEPGTASSEFFICINDQPELDYGGKRNPDGQGFAAFGQVIKGMKIVKKIQMMDSKDQILMDRVPVYLKIQS